MRIVSTLTDKKRAHLLSSFLATEGIENQLEINTNVDWGSPNYSDVTCKIWVIDEDQVPAALRWVELFEKDPENSLFQKVAPKTTLPFASEGLHEEVPTPPSYEIKPPPMRSPEKMGPITFYILIICSLLFLIDMMTTPSFTEAQLPTNLPLTPLLSSPIKKAFYYDYPEAFTIVDRLNKLFGLDKLQNPQELPKEGQYLLTQLQHTPYWQGLYDLAKKRIQQPETPIDWNVPLFEKIREGQLWRLFTPCVLHNDILHILFNMLWLLILGKQIEQRLSKKSYIWLILVTGIFSNTCQYLMSGSNFIGFSGVLCAMLTFIWMRQRVAPWEGYPLQKATIAFMIFFIVAMFSLQVISFYVEAQHQMSLSPGIANTAHLTGAFIGAVLGRLSLFSWKT